MITLNSNVLVLLSGGIDSSACVFYYITQGASVSGLFVDYAQHSSSQEKCASIQISKHYKIPINIIKMSGHKSLSGGYIRGRNSFLLYAAMMHFQYESGIVALGIHKGTSYRDCSPGFIQVMQDSFDIYTDGCVQIGVPFADFSKRDIWDYCKSNKNIPLHLTYSCELGKKQPCGYCSSCKDLEALYAC